MNGRERILTAANQMFGVRPFQEVSVAPLIAAAEVQAPTLYHHFGDKEGLYVAWAHGAFLRLGSALAAPQARSVLEGLTAFATMFYNATDFDVAQVVRDVESLERPSSREEVFNLYFQAVYEPLCAILLAGIESGELNAEPIGRLADVFLASMHALKGKGEDSHSTASWLAQRFLTGHRAKG